MANSVQWLSQSSEIFKQGLKREENKHISIELYCREVWIDKLY